MGKCIKFNRRQMLKGMALGAGLSATTGLLTGCPVNMQFLHGVASGDPLQDRVILWTRLSTANTTEIISGRWQIALDQHFKQIINSGEFHTNASRDYTVKVDVVGLSANTAYFYRFIALNVYSPVGQTKTLPQGHVESVRLGVVSCASYPHGFFNVYREMTRNDFDFVVHLGDYIYEYAPSDYDDQDDVAQQRIVNPPHELYNLSDYRMRYAQYRGDPDLKALHAQRPFICVWDDHEVANDAWRAGAKNHSADEGNYEQRRQYAFQAYFEWMPIRGGVNKNEIYRQFKFGDLLNLYLLDTRHLARDKPLSHLDYINNVFVAYDYMAADAAIRNPQRTLLGSTQKQWLKNMLSNTTTTWQVFAQQILMGRMLVPWRLAAVFQLGVEIFDNSNIEDLFAPEFSFPEDISTLGPRLVGYNLDAWDGYYAEREELFNTIKNLNLNFINLAGDTHNAWANDLKTQNGDGVGVEFATASVSSPGISDFLQGIPFLNELFMGLVQDLKYANVYERGFMVLDIKHNEAVAEWMFINTVKSKIFFKNIFATKKMKVVAGAGNRKLQAV